MKKLLCISYRFAPETYPLAIRVENFIAHLDKEYEIEAITAAENARAPDGVTVHHIEPRVPNRFIGWLRRRRLGKFINLIFWPDAFVFWVRPAYKKAKALIKKHKPDAIVVFMMPYSQGLIGVMLKRAFGIPLIMNLNDSPTCSGQNPSFPSRLHFFLTKKLEDLYIRYADSVVYVSKQSMERVQKTMPSAKPEKMYLVRRGAKPVNVEVATETTEEIFRIVYAGGMGGWHAFQKKRRGSMSRRLFEAWERLGTYELVQLDYRGHSPVFIGKAVKQLIEKRPEWKGKIAVEIYGNRFPQHTVDRLLTSEGIDEVVAVHGVMPHSEVLQKIFGADLLFMALPEHRDGSPDPRISSKTYEYLMSGRPILAGLPPGENRNFLASFEGTHIVMPKDVEGMQVAVEALAEQYFAGESIGVDRSQHYPLLSVGEKAERFEQIVQHAIDPARAPKPASYEKELVSNVAQPIPSLNGSPGSTSKKSKRSPMIKRIARAAAVRALRPLGKTGILGTITHVNTTTPLVSLTFDDGPDPAYTPALLDILSEFDARATFFMVGESAEKYPDLVKRVSEAGHTVANHTWNHPSLRQSKSREVDEQLRKCSNAISPYEDKILRPPWGELSLSSRYRAYRNGYQVVTWNAHAQDWIEPDADKMTERLMAEIKPGSIILLHDTIYFSRNENVQRDRSAVFQAVRNVLAQTKGSYQFVTLPELLKKGEPVYKRVGW